MAINEKIPPTMLIILDGFGYKKETKNNAIALAKMPNWKNWVQTYPNTILSASGKAVGLLPCCLGNSEVGHTVLGSGRIIKTASTKFHDAISDGSFFKNKMLINHFETLKNTNRTLHLMGLLSDAGVHSHQEDLFALLKLAHQQGLKKVFIHAFLDGRDTPPKSAAQFLTKLEEVCKTLQCGTLASLHGRFYAMDRDNNWERIQKSYDVLCGKTKNTEKNWKQLLHDAYTQNITDEFFEPTLLTQEGIVKDGDGLIYFNFRPDRAKQITEAFLKKPLAFFVTTTRYKKEFTNDILFEKENVKHTLLDEIGTQTNGKKVFVIAETEKYAHVTYFFRGMNETHLNNEQYTLIPSIKTKSYADYPHMSAQKITDALLLSLHTDPAYFYLVNYANPDMVGHSGNLNATIAACEFLDTQLAQLYEEVVEKQHGTIFITGDHGNAEEMVDESGNPKTAHSQNPVIFIMINKKKQHKNNTPPLYPGRAKFGLSVVAPTILKHLKLQIPSEMSNTTLF